MVNGKSKYDFRPRQLFEDPLNKAKIHLSKSSLV